MVKLNQDATAEGVETVDALLQKLASVTSASPTPQVVCAVGRKANIGHFETVDIFFGVTLPLVDVDPTDIDELTAGLRKAAEIGFQAASLETGSRYKLIKEAISGGPRDPKPEEKPF